MARLVRRNGIEDVLTALRDLPDTELLIAGGVPGEAFARDPEVRRLRMLARQLDVDDRVTLLGFQSRSKVAALLRSGDIVVSVPWYEPFGIVALEAMACGVAVAGSSVGALLDTAQHGRTGL